MANRRIVEASAASPEASGLLGRYVTELVGRLGGFDPERSVSADPAEMERPLGVFLLVYEGEVAVACGGLKTLRPGVSEIKRMYVADEARGRGHGRALLDALIEQAREAGSREVLLDTAAPLLEATRLYETAGFEETAAYNDNPYAARWFRKRL